MCDELCWIPYSAWVLVLHSFTPDSDSTKLLDRAPKDKNVGWEVASLKNRCRKALFQVTFKTKRSPALPSMSLVQWESGWNLIGGKICPQVGNAGCLWCLLATCLTPISIFISRGAVREKYGIDGDSVKDQTHERNIREGEGKVTRRHHISDNKPACR